MAYAFISEQNKLAQPNLNYVWDPNTLSWVKEEQPVIDGSTIVVTGVATAANQVIENASLASIDGKTPSLGQALATASVPVVLTAAQLSTLTPPAAITGFATAAKQDTGNASLASIDGKLANPLPTLEGLSIPAHDYVALSYTGSNLTTVTFKSGGAGGSTVATLTLAYTGSVLDTVTKT